MASLSIHILFCISKQARHPKERGYVIRSMTLVMNDRIISHILKSMVPSIFSLTATFKVL